MGPMYGLVIDKNGKPRIDDPENMPEPMKAMLTVEHREKLGDEMCRRIGITTAAEERAKPKE